MPRKPRRCCAYPGCPKLAEEKSTYCAEHKKVMDKQYQTYERPTDINKKYGRAWKRFLSDQGTRNKITYFFQHLFYIFRCKLLQFTL